MRNLERNVARQIREENLQAIEEVVRGHPDGMTAQQISEALKSAPPRRTLQYRIKSLVDAKRLLMKSSGRGARYSAPREISLEFRATAGVPTAKVRLEGTTATLRTRRRDSGACPAATRVT